MTAIQDKFTTTRREMATAMIERDDEIDAALTAMVSRQHLLLVGPPGTAKSMLLDTIMEWMNAPRFAILLTKFTGPEEVFGPIDVAAMKESRYRRVTTSRLPEACGCFVDEIWKASSAILNTLLKVLNERRFDNGDGEQAVPLRICVAASNEWPQSNGSGKELGAVFDRFLFRKEVGTIKTEAGWDRLIDARATGVSLKPQLTTAITPMEIDQAHGEAMSLDFSDEALVAFKQIRRDLASSEGIRPLPRRVSLSVDACKASAYLAGATMVEPEHLEILQHTMWDEPESQPRKAAEIVCRIANPTAMAVNSLRLEVEEILTAVDLRQLSSAAMATGKLQGIAKKLADIPGDKAKRALEHVRSEVKRIKLASIEAM
jgi:MoxR-like ATPase